MAQTLIYLLSASFVCATIIVAIYKALQGVWQAREALLDARIEVTQLQARNAALEANIEDGISYSMGLLVDLQEAIADNAKLAQRHLEDVDYLQNVIDGLHWEHQLQAMDDDELGRALQEYIAARIFREQGDIQVTAKLASRIGGKLFRILDEAKRRGNIDKFLNLYII